MRRLWGANTLADRRAAWARKRATRAALVAGEFDDPCSHGTALHTCKEPQCRDLASAIISFYERAEGAAQ